MKHLGNMLHCDSQKKESLLPTGKIAPVTSSTKTKQNKPGEQSKEEREQALAECRERCGIIPGKMTVQGLRTAPEPE